MPSALSNRNNNYYTAHHRKPSSQSQSNLPDQLTPPQSQVRSPNRSLVYLPSSTYTNTHVQDYAQSLSATRYTQDEAADDVTDNVTDNVTDESTGDPHDFYRQYQDHFTASPSQPLHQTALRPADPDQDQPNLQSKRRKSSVASAHSQEATTLGNARNSSSARQLTLIIDQDHPKAEAVASGTLRARKASFRDLVARFDSPDDVPPLPALAYSANSSRKASPVVYANPHPNFSQSQSFHGHHQSVSSPPTHQAESASNPAIARQKRPLFGEVPPGINTASLGYGIINARRRRGSEGSPMHSPNSMFPQHGSPATGREQPTGHFLDQATQAMETRPYHRRANSDFVGTPTHPNGPNPFPILRGSDESHQNGHPTSAPSHARKPSTSRIPLSTRRTSLTSDSGPSNPSSRANSKLDHHQSVPHSSQSKFQKPVIVKTKPTADRRKPQSQIHIQSPGRQGRGKAVPSSEKSPSLRANIIAPPPKISPPLRSSRPRLPVSSATTASSRARMAEKFQTMAKEQSDKQSTSRKARPPELSDIDLKARRLRITQALTRSREGQDLKSTLPVSSRNTSRKNSTSSTSQPAYGVSHQPPNVPALVIESVHTENDGDVFCTPDEERSKHDGTYPKNALSQSQARSGFSDDDDDDDDDDDSPTLGQGQDPSHLTPSRLQTNQLWYEHDPAEISAITQDTLDTTGTAFDNEPQSATAEPERPDLSLLTSVTSMREQNSASSRSDPSPTGDQLSDHADEESVHIILRDTTYLDDDEAVAKGYRPFVPPAVPAIPDQFTNLGNTDNNRESWTSSIPQDFEDHLDNNAEAAGTAQIGAPDLTEHLRSSDANDNSSDFNDLSRDPQLNHDFLRDTTASDAYTIVNIVLQQKSTSGVVDQQLVDDIYQRIVAEEPELAESEDVNPQRVEALCLREIEAIDREWQETAEEDQRTSTSKPDQRLFTNDEISRPEPSEFQEIRPPPLPKDSFPPPSFRAHKYKSSLDSAEDWADTSPSIGDWIKYAVSPDEEKPNQFSALSKEVKNEDEIPADISESPQQEGQNLDPAHSGRSGPPLDPSGLPARPPSHSPPPPPPPPPISKITTADHASPASTTTLQGSLTDSPSIPRRVACVSPFTRSQMPSIPLATQPIIAEPAPAAEDVSQEQKRLKQRRHVLKELVDTEYSYERDLRVLCDIYKQTASAALAEEDIKTLFGNIEQVQVFARDFLIYLKSAAKPAYMMERQNPSRAQTRTPTSDQMSVRSEPLEQSDAEKDQMTLVGQAFLGSMNHMEEAYGEYIRTRHAANKKFEQISTQKAVQEWLNECRANSSDITNAWSLDALLVKPIQRITKYPLLLNELVSSTTPNHPDLSDLRKAALNMTEVNVRINEVKKHTELVDQVMNRKRKESDVRNGLTKAWGRRTEKLRQQVGMNETYEDGEYARLKMDYDNNSIHLFIVSKDCQGYIEALTRWVNRMVEMAACGEAWVDIGHTNNPIAESKLRQLAIAVRGIVTIALPDHIDTVNRKIIVPMEKCKSMLDKFNLEPKGLIQKREKKLIDYNQAKNKRDRGEKLDKKMIERMEQWEAINRETKERMRKLKESTANLVQACLGILVQIHMEWLFMIQKKLSSAMAISLNKLAETNIEKEWQVDFDYQEATALALGLCNGSLLTEAVNMVSFLTPGSTTLNGDDSPRQSSWNTKRSISLNSESTHFPPGSDGLSFRHSAGQHSSHSEYPPESSSFGANSRMRAASLASNRTPKTPEMPHHSAGVPPLPSATTYSRPATSMALNDEGSMYGTGIGPPPRVSLDMPSPSIRTSPLRTYSPAQAQRPTSSQTFFSVAPTPNTSAPNSAGMIPGQFPTEASSQPPSMTRVDTTQSTSSIFSSAMPLPDSPVESRCPAGSEPPTSLDPSANADAPKVLFTVASIYEFNIDRARQEAGIPYLTYVAGEIFDVVGERGELWLARNQDDPNKQVGWIWCKHFAKLAV